MTWPQSPIFRPLFRIYFFGLVPLVGWFVTGQREPYRYLPRSVRDFLSPPELAEEMRQAGLREVRYRVMAMGTVAVHTGVKGGDGCRPAQPKFDGGD
jgi:demethylmenaquinone methyltransferase/2-methoxy-6-polyprenyl-1,4-benzoquinol methylase